MPYEEFLFMIFIQRAGGSVSEAGQKKNRPVCVSDEQKAPWHESSRERFSPPEYQFAIVIGPSADHSYTPINCRRLPIWRNVFKAVWLLLKRWLPIQTPMRWNLYDCLWSFFFSFCERMMGCWLESLNWMNEWKFWNWIVCTDSLIVVESCYFYLNDDFLYRYITWDLCK